MKAKIISVGKKSGLDISTLCGEYEKRLSRNIQIEWLFIEPIAGKMSRVEQQDRESRKVAAQISPNDYVVLLDEGGKALHNHELAKMYQQWSSLPGQITIVIGGAFGVSETLKKRADYMWSLSSLVFPHEIVRLLLVEQLYRSQSIIDGLPYHHE